MKTMLIAVLWLWPLAPAAQNPASASPGGLPSSSGEYVIGPKDVISVTIFNEEAMSRPSLTVDAEGTVDMPHIGRVAVGGLTARQVEDMLLKRYSGAYLINPSISVVVKEFRNMLVYVRGAVKNPGTVELKGDPTLLAALTEAGCCTSEAGSYIVITHAAQGQAGPTLPDATNPKDQIRVSRDDYDTGLAAKMHLRAGDTVFVSRAEKFFITGQVKSPGEYVLSERLNVLQAMTLAGGPTERAATNRIKIQRVVNGKMKEVSVKESDLVHPGDTIQIPTRFW